MKSFWKSLFLSVFIVNGLALVAILVYRHSLKERLADNNWAIRQIVERGRGELPPGFFAEALDLSQDRPTPWDLFDEKDAEKKLSQFAFLSDVKVRKVQPATVVVDYSLRTPALEVADFGNRAIDREGVSFPLQPYYSPKRLPKIYFGGAVSQERALLAFSLLERLSSYEQPPRLLLIDLSESEAPELGKQKIVMVIQEAFFEGEELSKQLFILQLSAKNPRKSLEQWGRMRGLAKSRYKQLKSKRLSIDLRLPSAAYMSS